MIVNWKGYRGKWSWLTLRYYLSICLDGMREIPREIRSRSANHNRDVRFMILTLTTVFHQQISWSIG